MTTPLLHVDAVSKRYTRGLFDRKVTFSLEADFVVEAPTVVGVMGPNGSGKTTLFELITGSNLPSAGRVKIVGQDIHRVRYRERDRLALHYHQSYQVRAFKRTRPSFMLEAARSSAPLVHLFDEPQFSIQDGYIGFMLQFFRRLRDDGNVVLLCVHPNEAFHLEVLAQSCERFLFVHQGKVLQFGNLDAVMAYPDARAYLGGLTNAAGSSPAGHW